MGEPSTTTPDEVRTAEVIGSLCLATDLAMGFPFEHGLHSTLVAMRLADRLGLDQQAALQTYFGCMLLYAGCTTDAEAASGIFRDGALYEHFQPVIFGSPRETVGGIMRALADPGRGRVARTVQGAARLPRASRGHQRHIVAMCEVAQMLCDRLGVPAGVRALFDVLTARWEGNGTPRGVSGEQIPIAMRVVHVARDATFQAMLGGVDRAVRLTRERAGRAFDPDVAAALLNDADSLLDVGESGSVWPEVLACEPGAGLVLRGDEIDQALSGIGDFADLICTYFVGHSAGVAELAERAGSRLGLAPDDVVAVRRAARVHDVGRVAVAVSAWNTPGGLTADQWEQVRLHPYHTERVLSRGSALSALAPIAGAHHERLDGSGYHRGTAAPGLAMPARILAAADAYRTMVEPRPHRPALPADDATRAVAEAADLGRLDRDAATAVIEAAGQPVPPMTRPAGLTEREAQVIAMVARGLQTKQVGHRLGISPKTADHHLQNAYAKIGVSTRAAATLFAMQHGLAVWGEFPIPDASARP